MPKRVARACRQFRALRNAVRKASYADKASHVDSLASTADRAAAYGDNTYLYKLDRNFSKYSPPSIKTVNNSDGAPTKSPAEYDARWLQHFQSVFSAKLVPKIGDIGVEEPAAPFCSLMPCPPLEVVSWAIASLANSKAVGPDGIPAEFLKAAGAPFACLYYELFRHIWYKAYVPLMWRGGRLAELFKKGSTLACDNYRGLLISDHMSKVFTKILNLYVDPYYIKYMPSVQCGGVPRKGTDFATHLVRSVIDFASLKGLSFSIVFIDLVKAFDFTIRELAVGWPQCNVPSRVAHLSRLGLSNDRARAVADDIDEHGCILEQLQAHPHVIEMLRSLHTGSWFQFGSAADVLVVEKGGRQGCCFGGKIFNFAYAKALSEVRAKLEEKGITMHVHFVSGAPPFGAHRVTDSSAPIVDIVFVDDAAAFVFAASPITLTRHIRTTVSVFYDVFCGYLMALNFQKGKTEAMVKYRGKGARDAKENLRKSVRADGANVLPVELAHGGSTCNTELVITDVYKHLGSLVSVDGLLAPEAHARVHAAMSSYAPLSMALLGSQSLALARRLRLGWSLVIPRLCYNIHIWSHFPYAIWRILNTMYNRLWRRLYGQPRFCHVDRSDLEIRMALGVPSLDCWVRRRRLKYLSRLAVVDLPALHALLQADDGKGNQMPWVSLVLEDLAVIRSALPRVLGSLPPPSVDASQYWEIARSFPQEWGEIVAQYFTSCDDPGRSKQPGSTQSGAGTFQCDLCTHEPFGCSRALAQHQRVAHGKRTVVGEFVGDWRTCPICSTTFATRLHLVNHLAEKRVRSKFRAVNCGIEFLSRRPPPIEATLLSTLRSVEKEERQQARKKGHTRPIVSSAAQRGRPSCLKGLSSERMKRLCVPHRRLGSKTDPRNSASCASRPVLGGGLERLMSVPARTLQCTQQALPLQPTKRLQAKTTPTESCMFKRHCGNDCNE